MNNDFEIPISRRIWETKYRYQEAGVIHDKTVRDTWRRVARACAQAEEKDQSAWETRFYRLLEGFKFLPAGRILAGAGTERQVTLFNCFVMGIIHDSMDGIFDALKESALTMQQGGGIGYDFSTLRPYGTHARGAGVTASGPVSFMHIWDSMCATLLSTGARRGAMMATLRCDHPDIERFIAAKQDQRSLRHFNLSVQVSDAFMCAIEEDKDWALVFPADRLAEEDPLGNAAIVKRHWPGYDGAIPCLVIRTVRARSIWDQLMGATHEYSEPGVLFIDRINHLNNLWYRERITTTNPCGEVPLPPYGACNLGSINLASFVERPFTPKARIDMQAIQEAVPAAVRMLDNVIDISRFPLQQQELQARGTRRIGLGITGLADALIMLGLKYDDPFSLELAADIMRTISHTAFRSSVDLAREKDSFPWLDKERYLDGPFVRSLPEDIRAAIAQHGIRNSHLIAIAPIGTISLVANNVSSGLEPVFEVQYRRRVLEEDGTSTLSEVSDCAWRRWRDRDGSGGALPAQFVDARALSPAAHLKMQASLQPYVDNSTSKTINVSQDMPYVEFRSVYEQAYTMGLKGCTTFRPNPNTGSVLTTEAELQGLPHCCGIEREPD